MSGSSLSVSQHNRPHTQQDHRVYTMRVRGTVFLWGSDGIIVNMHFNTPLLLHVHNDVFGEAITLGTQDVAGVRQDLGTLQAGQFLSIPIQDVSALFATCQLESTVTCMIR